MSKHTPGPWRADIEGPFTLGGDGTTVDAVTEDGKEVRREICHLLLDTGDGDDENPDLEEDLANARLIAAAPCLLACLTDLVGLLTERFHPEDIAVQRSLKEARAAIAKVTGEAP